MPILSGQIGKSVPMFSAPVLFRNLFLILHKFVNLACVWLMIFPFGSCASCCAGRLRHSLNAYRHGVGEREADKTAQASADSCCPKPPLTGLSLGHQAAHAISSHLAPECVWRDMQIQKQNVLQQIAPPRKGGQLLRYQDLYHRHPLRNALLSQHFFADTEFFLDISGTKVHCFFCVGM